VITVARDSIGNDSVLSTGHESWIRRNWRPITSILTLLLVWQIVGSMLDPIFLSTPIRVGQAFWGLLLNGELVTHLLITLQTFAVGLILGVVVGVPFGLLAGRYQAIALHSDPIIRLFYSLPNLALFPLFLIWFGIGDTFRLAMVFFSAVIPMIMTTQAGVVSVDPVLLDVARIARTSERQVFLKIVLPSTLPYIAAGFRLAIGRAMTTAIVVEFLTGINGLGGRMSLYGNTFQTDRYFAPLVATSMLAFTVYYFGDRLESRFSKWRPRALN
jgi:NitT/TauT family transport system permease protein